MLQVRVSPVMEDGEALNVIWTHVDVTERHQEERLLELRNRALNYMSDGIFICDRQGSVLYTNQGFARLTGYEQRDAVGQPWTFLAVRRQTISRASVVCNCLTDTCQIGDVLNTEGLSVNRCNRGI